MPDLITAKSLREKRAVLAKKTRELADKVNNENRDFTAEEKPAWEALDKDYNALTRQIEIAERADERDADQDAKPPRKGGPGREDTDMSKRGRNSSDGAQEVTEEHRSLALQGWLSRPTRLGISPEQKRAAKLVGMNPNAKVISINLARDYRAVKRSIAQAAHLRAGEARSLSATLPTAGAYTIPEGFVANLETALLAFANVRAVADVMRTESGNDLPWPTANDTTNKGAILAENTAAATNVDPTWAQVIFKAYKYTSKIVLVPVELLQDTAFQLATWLGDMLGTRLGRIQADHFTTGTGAGQPTGIVTAATSGKSFASATAITADELYALKHAVDPAYRSGASWMFNDSTLLYIKQLKDGMGRYLWQSSLAGGAPDMLDGDPITINQSMSSIATGNKSVLYGLMSKFKIRDAGDVRLRRLDERYADADQVAFVAFIRSDSNLLDAGTHPIKYGVQA